MFSPTGQPAKKLVQTTEITDTRCGPEPRETDSCARRETAWFPNNSKLSCGGPKGSDRLPPVTREKQLVTRKKKKKNQLRLPTSQPIQFSTRDPLLGESECAANGGDALFASTNYCFHGPRLCSQWARCRVNGTFEVYARLFPVACEVVTKGRKGSENQVYISTGNSTIQHSFFHLIIINILICIHSSVHHNHFLTGIHSFLIQLNSFIRTL